LSQPPLTLLFYLFSAADILPAIISHAVAFAKHVDLILRHELFTCLTSMLHNRLPGVTDAVRLSLVLPAVQLYPLIAF
jgi:hypothetical protein